MTSFSNINVQNYGFFKESRCFFEGYTKDNDINPETKKAGVRCHNWFTAFFLRILGKIETINTADGKKIYLNKNSYLKWRQRHSEEMPKDESNSLPTASNILKHRTTKAIQIQSAMRGFLARKKLKELKELKQRTEAAIACQRRIHGRNTKRKYQELLKLHKRVQTLEASKKDLDQLQKNIDAYVEARDAQTARIDVLNAEIKPLVETAKQLDERKKVLEDASGIFETTKRRALKLDHSKVKKELAEKKEAIAKNLQDLQPKREMIAALEDSKAELEQGIDRLQTEKKMQEGLAKELEETKEKIVEMREQILNRGSVLTTSVAPVEEEEEVQSPKEVMLEQIGQTAGNQIRDLMSALFSKFGEAIQSWNYEPSSGKYSITLDEERKLYINPKSWSTPKGVVFILNKKIKGTLKDKEITFDNGFGSFCLFREKVVFKTIEGEADGTFESIQYTEGNQHAVITSQGTARGALSMFGSKQDVKDEPYDGVLAIWRKGQAVTENPEAYIAKQSRVS